MRVRVELSNVAMLLDDTVPLVMFVIPGRAGVPRLTKSYDIEHKGFEEVNVIAASIVVRGISSVVI